MEFNAASILSLFIGLIIGGGAIYAVITLTGAGAGKKAEKIINDAKKEAEKSKRDSIIELKEETFKLKQEADREIKERKAEIQSSEERLLQRENSLDKREEMLQNRDNLLEQKDKNLSSLQKNIQEKELKMDELLKEEMEKLENIAKFSKEKAHDMIMERVENTMSKEIAEFIKDINLILISSTSFSGCIASSNCCFKFWLSIELIHKLISPSIESTNLYESSLIALEFLTFDKSLSYLSLASVISSSPVISGTL